MTRSPQQSGFRHWSLTAACLVHVLGAAGNAWGQSTTRLVAWGWNSHGQTSIPAEVSSSDRLYCGYRYTYALTPDGGLIGWGDNSYGQRNTPPGLPNVGQITCGYYHTYALSSDGRAFGWGRDDFGQSRTPTNLGSIAQTACGGLHTYALTSSGTTIGWGSGEFGQTDTPSGLSGILRIACGFTHSYALTMDGRAIGWGDLRFGQAATPTGLRGIQDISCGFRHSYARTDQGTLVGWGDNSYGQTSTPTNLTDIVEVACGYRHTYALSSTGQLIAWGWNAYGQTNTPPNASNPTHVAFGGNHAIAIQGWRDCNDNGVFDGDDIAFGGDTDMDLNGSPDSCQGVVRCMVESGDLGAPDPVAPASCTFAGLVPADADVTVVVEATGDFDAPNEFLTVRLVDPQVAAGYRVLGKLFEFEGIRCNIGSNSGSVTIPKDIFNRLAAAGGLSFLIVPSPPVTKGECTNGGIRLSFTYLGIGPGGDCDGDLILDVREMGQDETLDANLDGHLDSCSWALGDLDLSGEVDTGDVAILLLYIGDLDSPVGDLDADGLVTTADISLLLMNFGPVVWP